MHFFDKCQLDFGQIFIIIDYVVLIGFLIAYNYEFFWKKHNILLSFGEYKFLVAQIVIYHSNRTWNNMPFYKTRLFKTFSSGWGSRICIFRPIEALEVVKLGGFGNNYWSIINAMSIATDLNVTDIYVDQKEFWWINKDIPAGKFRMIPGKPPKNINLMKHDFYYGFPNYKINKQPYQDLLIPHLKSKLPPINIPDDTLVLHVRSGDIFSYHVDEGYAQPPLCFYKMILEKRKWKNIILLAVDKLNPVIPELIKMGIKYEKMNIQKTIQYIYYSKNLVQGYGTFIDSILRCCDVPKLIYMFGDYRQKHFPNYGGRFNKTFKIYANPRTNEFNKVMSPFYNNITQNLFQIKSECDIRWFKVSEGPNVTWEPKK